MHSPSQDLLGVKTLQFNELSTHHKKSPSNVLDTQSKKSTPKGTRGILKKQAQEKSQLNSQSSLSLDRAKQEAKLSQ